MSPTKRFQCFACGKIIEIPRGTPKPAKCPYCGASQQMIHRIDKGPPGGRRGRGPRWMRG